MEMMTLAEAKCEAKRMSIEIDGHRHEGSRCRPACYELTRMRDQLSDLRRQIREWFKPNLGDETLF